MSVWMYIYIYIYICCVCVCVCVCAGSLSNSHEMPRASIMTTDMFITQPASVLSCAATELLDGVWSLHALQTLHIHHITVDNITHCKPYHTLWTISHIVADITHCRLYYTLLTISHTVGRITHCRWHHTFWTISHKADKMTYLTDNT